MTILVTGGAGYIGSAMTRRLLDEKMKVIVVDNLSRGYRDAVDQRAEFIKGELQDVPFVNSIFEKNKINAVIHFAGYISVAESMENPTIYFKNNLISTINILESMQRKKVRHFIFSSSAAVYGNPVRTPIQEDHPQTPTNPYGESKLMVEQLLKWYHKIFDIQYACLRYFNAAGAISGADIGERHIPETHIIPLAIKSALAKSEFTIFGDDYNTKDKTAVRDYIHVVDLVNAHLLTLKKLESDGGEHHYNVGTGVGHSNKEVTDVVKKITGVDFKIKIGKRRPGDPETLIADPTKIKSELKFFPKMSDLQTIVKTAWEWHKRLK